MAVNIKVPDVVESIKGIRLAAASAAIYDHPRPDLALLEIAEGSSVSAVFTQNKFCAAPVCIARQHLQRLPPRYFIVNAGNANAGTGKQGLRDAVNTCERLAAVTNCKTEQILPFSTGVIGKRLPVKNIENRLDDLVGQLSADNWFDTARAIMTTDTLPKLASTIICLDNTEVRITGIAKGSGMIRPNMATMLAFAATDADICQKTLDGLLRRAVDKSFNRITVDGDTSTNDACVLVATGQAGNAQINTDSSVECEKFERAATELFSNLAQTIVRDGEGASKFIEIEVYDGATTRDCLEVAYSIAQSPLVKTAFTASDPNWGRILAAVGNAHDMDMDINDISIFLDDLCIFDRGQLASNYRESASKEIMLKDEIKISIGLGTGKAREKIWTTDLSHEYITINAAYRT